MTLLQLDVPFEAESPTCVTVTAPPQLSDAVTEPMFGAGTSEKHWTPTAAGQVIDGGVVSLTVIVCVQVRVLPHASVALVGPGDDVVAARRAVRGRVADVVTVTAPPQLSDGGDRGRCSAPAPARSTGRRRRPGT